MALFLSAGLGSFPTLAATEEAGDIQVRVDIQDGKVRIDVEAPVPASLKEVWDVMTDFEHLSRFISNVKTSRVLERNGDVVRVEQSGKVGFGPLSYSFQSVRELTLSPPFGFESRMVSGNMKHFRGTTRLVEEQGLTLIRYHAEAEPEFLPPFGLARPFIAAETREHYQEMRQEVMRRNAEAKPH